MENFFDIIGSKSLTLVDFYATWCGPCKAMHPVLEQLKAQAGDRVRIIKLDVDRARSVAEQYGIMAVPTLMLFRDGKVLWRKSGSMSLGDLLDVIRKYS
ncbi:MAG: thioredoxin [bacterium]|nr:thioredoxin [bacterium]MDD6026534.1 thioredoxin [bacterium]